MISFPRMALVIVVLAVALEVTFAAALQASGRLAGAFVVVCLVVWRLMVREPRLPRR